jgi:hypothetical protein
MIWRLCCGAFLEEGAVARLSPEATCRLGYGEKSAGLPSHQRDQLIPTRASSVHLAVARSIAKNKDASISHACDFFRRSSAYVLRRYTCVGWDGSALHPFRLPLRYQIRTEYSIWIVTEGQRTSLFSAVRRS